MTISDNEVLDFEILLENTSSPFKSCDHLFEDCLIFSDFFFLFAEKYSIKIIFISPVMRVLYVQNGRILYIKHSATHFLFIWAHITRKINPWHSLLLWPDSPDEAFHRWKLCSMRMLQNSAYLFHLYSREQAPWHPPKAHF